MEFSVLKQFNWQKVDSLFSSQPITASNPVEDIHKFTGFVQH